MAQNKSRAPSTSEATSAAKAPPLDAVRAQLLERARTLGADLRAVEAERTEAFEHGPLDTVQDAGDQGEQRTREIVLSAVEDREAGELADIQAALQRLDAGSYGACVDCDMAIPVQRLQVQPAAARCVPCQERYEVLHPPGLPTTPVV